MNVYKTKVLYGGDGVALIIVAANNKKEAEAAVSKYFKKNGLMTSTFSPIYRRLPNLEYKGGNPKIIATPFNFG